MLITRVSKLLEMLKSPGTLFDSDACKNIKLHKLLDKGPRPILHFGLPVEKKLCNVHLSLHGGAHSTIVDCLTTIHAWSLDPKFRIALSTDLSVTFYSSSKMNQYLDIYTEVLSIDENFAFTVANLFVEGTQVARGTQTLYFLNKSVDSIIKPN